MSKSILITDKVHDLLVNGLTQKGFHVDYHPNLSYQEVKLHVPNYEGIVINSKVICDRAFLDEFDHLDFIGRLGSGLDIINLPHASGKGIAVISSPEGNANAVGEHALGMLLTLQHNISIAHSEVAAMYWNREENRGSEIKGKTIGILGFGHTGPAFANKLKGFDVEILVYDKYRSYLNAVEHIRSVSLEELLSSSDIVSLHLPLTKETRYMVDSSFLRKMKKGAILINTSRGKIVESSSLDRALNTGHLGGACLDVLENEKPETWTSRERKIYESILTRKNVIATPHIAGWTHESLQLIAQILLDKILRHYEQ